MQVGDGGNWSLPYEFTTVQAISANFSSWRLGVVADLGITRNSTITFDHLTSSMPDVVSAHNSPKSTHQTYCSHHLLASLHLELRKDIRENAVSSLDLCVAILQEATDMAFVRNGPVMRLF